jgi:hypothetical protein
MKERERLAERCRYGAKRVFRLTPSAGRRLVSERYAVWTKLAATDPVAAHRGADALLAAIADPVRTIPGTRLTPPPINHRLLEAATTCGSRRFHAPVKAARLQPAVSVDMASDLPTTTTAPAGSRVPPKRPSHHG